MVPHTVVYGVRLQRFIVQVSTMGHRDHSVTRDRCVVSNLFVAAVIFSMGLPRGRILVDGGLLIVDVCLYVRYVRAQVRIIGIVTGFVAIVTQ